LANTQPLSLGFDHRLVSSDATLQRGSLAVRRGDEQASVRLSVLQTQLSTVRKSMKLFSLEAEKRRHKLMVKDDDDKGDKLNGGLGGEQSDGDPVRDNRP
jgi:hypothetical protein